MMSALLTVEHLKVQVPALDRPLLRGVSLRVGVGEAVALVGESGSGKSLTTRAILRLLPQGSDVQGLIEFDGQDVMQLSGKALRRWRATEVGMIFQDPKAHINPVRTVGDFLLEGLDNRFANRREAHKSAMEMLREVGISNPEQRAQRRPHELSGGLLQRVMIASVLLRQPRLLLADEPTTALDVTTQADVMAIIDEQRQQRGMAMLFITHDLDLASAVCDRIAVMYAGAIVEQAPAEALVDAPAHPYTAGLLRSRPELGREGELHPIAGRPISGAEVGQGCAFAPRCAAAMDVCLTDDPELRPSTTGSVACQLWQDRRLAHSTEVLHV
ncbi:oligopeptide/dipeptide ABC transporter ATP-binding protein [Mycobacterium frederiksbergense]|uniref:Oligopeptide/dipeptide ABC transporter ATP-binding protein n=2 Tax=Mycolicibacterium frederiksbergense TaxID=117567 RepID=A0ABT6L351_9MYCO|nr:oligopeptide/dipeptide ABC transporter ATP-binding protein [Mycolicibacterium frederiksbergense]